VAKNSEEQAVVTDQTPADPVLAAEPQASQTTPTNAKNEPFFEEVMIHVDDFLNKLDSTGRIELLSAFAKLHIAQGHVKETEEKWKKLLDEFTHAPS